jgi:hypothetical protein
MFSNAYSDTFSNCGYTGHLARYRENLSCDSNLFLNFFCIIQILGYKSTVLREMNMSQLLMNSWKLFLLAGLMLLYRCCFAILCLIWLTFSLHNAQSGTISQILSLLFCSLKISKVNGPLGCCSVTEILIACSMMMFRSVLVSANLFLRCSLGFFIFVTYELCTFFVTLDNMRHLRKFILLWFLVHECLWICKH